MYSLPHHSQVQAIAARRRTLLVGAHIGDFMEALALAPATMALIAANIMVSLSGFSNKEMFDQNVFWIAPIRVKNQWYRFISSGFLHVNPPHLFINMYVLYIFGEILEIGLGMVPFLLIYFASLLGGSAWAYFDNRENPEYRAAGASGATSGLVTAFSLFLPFEVLLLFFVIPMPAILLSAGFIAVSYYLSKKQGGLIAHGAHLGGALAGLATAIAIRPDAVGRLFEQITGFLG